MAKATFHRRFDATDLKKGVSVRVEPGETPQSKPAWVIDLAVQAGAATREAPPAAGAAQTKGD